METICLLFIGFCAYLNGAGSMEYTSRFKTLSDCSSANRNETDWSQFEDVTIVALDHTSVILQVEVSTEEFCIASCHSINFCVAIQVNTTIGNEALCRLLSYTPSIGKVRNQTGTKLFFKGNKKVYNIDTDVSTQCNGLADCSTLLMDGNVYLTMTDRHYDSQSEARNTCLSMQTPNGEFDLAIMDSASKIDAVRALITALPISTNVWLYTGGEAGSHVNDPLNKWTRTGADIDPSLWKTQDVIEPNLASEHCVMVNEQWWGLFDTTCDGEPGGPGQEINTLCEFFPD